MRAPQSHSSPIAELPITWSPHQRAPHQADLSFFLNAGCCPACFMPLVSGILWHGQAGKTIATNGAVCPGLVMVLAVAPPAPWQLMTLIQGKLGPGAHGTPVKPKRHLQGAAAPWLRETGLYPVYSQNSYFVRCTKATNNLPASTYIAKKHSLWYSL